MGIFTFPLHPQQGASLLTEYHEGRTLTLNTTAPFYQRAARKPRWGSAMSGSNASLLTKQGRQQGHRGPPQHTNLQMVTEGPISCCPITKRAPHPLPLPPPPPSLLSHLHPSLLSGKRKENRRFWDCIIASITVIIYTSILSYSLLFAFCCYQSPQTWSVQLRHAKQSR